MHAVRNAADLPPMGDNQRGQAIQGRLDRLGISDREFHEQTGIDRKTLRRAVAGAESTRPSTYAAIEVALSKLEERVGAAGMTPSPIGPDYIEFDVSGEGGFHVVVKGPIKDAALLREQVSAIIRDIRAKGNETE